MKKNKVLHIIKNVSLWVVSIFAVVMMIFTIISVTTFNQANKKIFGYQMYTVLSDSMKATDFEAGDLIFVKEVDPSTLKEGDIISYQSLNNDSFGEIITHKIRDLVLDADGLPGFITYGTTTDVNDEKVVVYSQVLGKYTGKIPNLGYFFTFLKTTPGYIACILLPFMYLIVAQGINVVILFRKYKKEQIASMNEEHLRQKQELEEERKRLEAQQAESKKMLEELAELKKQLSKEQSSSQVLNQDLDHQNESKESADETESVKKEG